MGDNGGADRNAANRERFEKLPPAGSPEYWAKLEDTAKATRLDLEILAMCARERLAAGRQDDFERVLGIIWDRVQGSARQQIEQSTPRSARDRARVIEDIMQECVTSLWLELVGEGDTFLTLGFWRKLRFMVTNAITQRHIAEGIRTRTNTVQPDRPPQNKTDSVDQPAGPDDDSPLGDRIPDPQANDPFSLAELVSDIKKLMEGLTAEQRRLIQNEWTGELTQKEIAKSLGVSDRTIRTWLKELQAWLRARYNDGGDVAGGEEGQS